MIPRKPKAKPGLAAWIEANVCLADGFVAEPGPMRLYPYQREMADAIGDPNVERVTLQKAARIGFSILVARRLDTGTPMIPRRFCVLPVDRDCKDFIRADLEPFAASPTLSDVRPPQTKGEINKRFGASDLIRGIAKHEVPSEPSERGARAQRCRIGL
jgi:phage terminase large subunit GpA-like protein